MLRSFLIFLFLLLCISTQAQSPFETCRWIKVDSTPQILDSLTVLPESIRIDQPKSGITFNFNLQKNEITIANTTLDSVRVCYSRLPFNLHKSKARKTLDIYDSAALFKEVALLKQQLDLPKREEIISTENITKTGSITRGVSFGNRQDVFVNSTLNLQMEGQLTENVNLRAVITDRTVPFQPEGNTQQLQDFDNVFIELYSDQWKLRAGDVVLKNGASNFLRYYKNVQGAQFNTQYELPGGFKAETTVAGSVAKGRFASISVDPIEGVLGPYRVRGPNNERFIIILAGSERVFIDGELQTRGYDQDYTIDYNLGEITFTNNVLITEFTRIRVDFEFSDQNYTRSIVQASHYQSNDKLNFAINYYSEKDNRNQPLAFELSDEEKRILANAGDDLTQAVTSRADSVAFSQELVLYRKTVGFDNQGRPFEIFQNSVNPDSAFFNVQFSEVGQGNGNYILLNSTANGRIYEWVAPINGQLQGSFEPVSILNAPNQKSMATIAGGVKLNTYDKLDLELAFSRNNVNLFSELDTEDDNGFASRVNYQSRDRPVSILNGYRLNAGFSYEFNNENFSFIDRLRYIEFDRDWSFNPEDFTERFAENILNADLNLSKDPNHNFEYKLVGRKRGDAVNGLQHYLKFNQDFGPVRWRLDGFFMNNDQRFLESSWNRLTSDFSLMSKWFIPGFRYRQDQNEVVNKVDQQVIRTAMNFRENTFYLRNSDTLKTKYGIEYQYRTDRLPVNGALVDNTESETYNAFFRTEIDPYNSLNVLFTYRNLERLNETGQNRNDETIMGRVDWVGSFFNRAIRSDLSYNLSNSRELRREFIFILVPTGEGTHTWRDDNGDGVQDLNEFYIAVNPDEKNYAKIFVPGDTFEEAFNTIINYRLNMDFPREWSQQGGLKKALSKFSNITSWSLNSKITDDDLGTRLLPLNVSEENLLAVNDNLRTTLFFNRSSTTFSADVGIAQIENQQLLLNGFERRLRKDLRYHARWNVNKRVNLDVNVIDGQRTSQSDVLTQRNYQVQTTTFEPALTWQPVRSLRLRANLALKDKQNLFTEASDEASQITELGVNARFAKAAKSTIGLIFRYIDIDFTGIETSPVGYELLEALRPGRNLTWNLNWQQRLGKGLQMVVRYDGRSSQGNRTVHLGRVQVSALF